MRGLEPPRPYGHTDLNRARLPIPPHPRGQTDSSLGSSHSSMTRSRPLGARRRRTPARPSAVRPPPAGDAARARSSSCSTLPRSRGRRDSARGSTPSSARFAPRLPPAFRLRRSAGATGSSRTGSRSRLPSADVPQLRSLPGVRDVLPTTSYGPRETSSPEQIGAPALWGPGLDTAGQGMKIGIIDSGVDPTHPFFDPAGYTMPPGFPKGQKRFTTAKVIVARVFPPKRGLRPPSVRLAFDPDDNSSWNARRGHRGRKRRHTRLDRVASPASPRAHTSATTRSSSRPTRASARTRTRPRSSPPSRPLSPTGWTSSTSRAASRRSSRAATSSRSRSTQPRQRASCR